MQDYAAVKGQTFNSLEGLSAGASFYPPSPEERTT